MKTYFIKVALVGVSPMIWRRLQVPGSTSLAMLHDIIQNIYGWDEFHLHQFHIYANDYGINYDGGLCYSDNAYKVYLDDFKFDIGDKFTYEYNLFEHHRHDIRIENIKELLVTKASVICKSGSGMPGATKHDVMDVELKMLETIVAKKGKLSLADIADYLEKLNRVKFNKKQVNKRLSSLTTP